MKKTIPFIAFAMVLSAVFIGCKKDEPNKPASEWFIDASVENGASFNSEIDSAYLYVGDVVKGFHIVGRAKYNGGNFQINPSATVPAKYLSDEEMRGEGLTLSDPSAKVALAFLAGSKNNNPNLAIVNHKSGEVSTNDFAGGVIMYVYADRDVKITGTSTETEEDEEEGLIINIVSNFDLNLKKGWNKTIRYYSNITNIGFDVELKSTNDVPAGYTWSVVEANWHPDKP